MLITALIIASTIATIIIYAACCVAKCHDEQHGRDDHMDETPEPTSTLTAII